MVVKDRLGDLKEGHVEVVDDKPSKERKKKKKAKDLESGGESGALDYFFDEVSFIAFTLQIGQLRDAVASVKQNVDKIDQIHQEVLNVISEQESKELEDLMSKTNKQTNDIRNKIKAMDTVNKTLAKDPENADDVRIRITQHGALAKRFLDVMMEYKDIQKKYQDRYKQRMQRQFLVIKPNATEEEIQNVVENKDGKNVQIFAQQVLNSGQKSEAKRALQDIQDRHTDIVRLEKGILELNQLFMDMSVLVAAQGELLNQIDTRVVQAIDTTESGVGALRKAVKTQKKSRKKMMMIVGCVLIAAVGIGVAIFLFS